jgi:hypothetical protein
MRKSEVKIARRQMSRFRLTLFDYHDSAGGFILFLHVQILPLLRQVILPALILSKQRIRVPQETPSNASIQIWHQMRVETEPQKRTTTMR